jgi:hypothetical protein
VKTFRMMSIMVVIVTCTATNGQGNGAGQFTKYIRAGGWEVPKPGERLEKCPAELSFSLTATEVVCYASSTKIHIPNYHADDGSLAVNDEYVKPLHLGQLRSKGKIFGYTAVLFGVSTADARRAWWIDRDGDGIFSEICICSEFPGRPKWLDM